MRREQDGALMAAPPDLDDLLEVAYDELGFRKGVLLDAAREVPPPGG
jgi:hypothetical protein